MDKYPLPDYAVSVWVVGDNLMVAFPGVATERGHTIKLPASQAGLATAIKLLREREHARDLRVAQCGTPTQWEVENDLKYKSWIKAMKANKATKQTELDEAIALLRDLDL